MKEQMLLHRLINRCEGMRTDENFHPEKILRILGGACTIVFKSSLSNQ
jgi:hypothetical protein